MQTEDSASAAIVAERRAKAVMAAEFIVRR